MEVDAGQLVSDRVTDHNCEKGDSHCDDDGSKQDDQVEGIRKNPNVVIKGEYCHIASPRNIGEETGYREDDQRHNPENQDERHPWDAEQLL